MDKEYPITIVELPDGTRAHNITIRTTSGDLNIKGPPFSTDKGRQRAWEEFSAGLKSLEIPADQLA